MARGARSGSVEVISNVNAQRSVVRSIAWLGLCGFIGGRGATLLAQLHNKFFAIIGHILSCKLESAFL
jgi:hypothetical protein